MNTSENKMKTNRLSNRQYLERLPAHMLEMMAIEGNELAWNISQERLEKENAEFAYSTPLAEMAAQP